MKNKIDRFKLYLWWMYSTKLEDPTIRRLSDEASQMMNVKPFKNIRISSKFAMANAAVIGFRCRTLVLTSTLLEIFTAEELKAVLLHEYAHCKLKHQLKLLAICISLLLCVALTVTHIVLSVDTEVLALSVSIPLLVLSYFPILLVSRLINKRFELEADCLAVSKLANPHIFVEVLRKIRSVNGEVKGWKALLSPHPPTDVRISYAYACFNKRANM